MRTWLGSVAAGLVAFASGCASTSAKPAFDEVARTVTAHTGHSVRWNQGGEEDRQVERAIDDLLKRDLTPDAAVQVALLANPALQAEFEELSISQADSGSGRSAAKSGLFHRSHGVGRRAPLAQSVRIARDGLPRFADDAVSQSVAIAQRLDVAAARRSIQAMDYGLSLAKGTRWTGTVNVSVEAGRLRDTKRLSFGPSVALEIPLFDQRQAQIAKLEAYKRQAENRLRSLAIDVRSDVRASQARVATARAVVEQYGKVLVPLRENVVRFSQQQYDAMLLGVYQLLQAKQTEVDTYREYIEALRDYWIARSELEHVIGGRLDARDAKAPAAHSAATSEAKEERL